MRGLRSEAPEVFFSALVLEQGLEVSVAAEVRVGVAESWRVVLPGGLDVDGVGLGESAVAADDDEVLVVLGAGVGGEVVAAGDDGRVVGERVDDEDLGVDDRVADVRLELLAGRLGRPPRGRVGVALGLDDVERSGDGRLRGPPTDDRDLQRRCRAGVSSCVPFGSSLTTPRMRRSGSSWRARARP